MPDYVRVSEYAQARGLSPKTVRRMCDDGRLECVLTVGGHRLIDRSTPIRPRSRPPAGSTTPPDRERQLPSRRANDGREPDAIAIARYEAIRPADEARAAVAVQEAKLARMRLEREAVQLQREYDREDLEREEDKAAEAEAERQELLARAEAQREARRAQHAAAQRAAADAKHVAFMRQMAGIAYVPYGLPDAAREVKAFIAAINSSMTVDEACEGVRDIVRRHQKAADAERRQQQEAAAVERALEIRSLWGVAHITGEIVKRGSAWDMTRTSEALKAVRRAIQTEAQPDMTYPDVCALATRVFDEYASRRNRARPG